MIKNPTVFILGAGASAPFGFPVGRALLMEICDRLSRRRNAPDKGTLGDLLHPLGFEQPHVEAFREDLLKSQQPSVDAFLENRREYLGVGKAAIAATLIPYEMEDKLYRTDWYEYLFGIIAVKPDAFRQSNLSIITFNYDRSLEQFLFTALKASFGLSDADAAELLGCLPIVHVHGLLGALPCMDSAGSRPYSPKVTHQIINESASQIRIINEVDGLGPEFKRAHEFISRASKVCFLGFGYHPANLDRLRINELFLPGPLGTGWGLRDAERNRIISHFKQPMIMGSPGQDVLEFLRSHSVFD